ncbi:GNAT family N-acetyltransferase [Silvibacterium sp.]|uniref:GNAT family N-acetyltransferase n=1 Tax=Silvibacterium sp. TaxID=1964179 RepID=UPI0039E33AFD
MLYALFAAEKRLELAPLALSEEQSGALIRMQFEARERAYASQFPGSLNMILTRSDGTVVGRHLVHRGADGYRSVDLAVLAEHRNSGIGSWALRSLQQLAKVERLPIELSVSKQNRAARLYQRLGFQKQPSNEVFWEMRWEPESLQPAQPAAAPHDIFGMTHGAFDRDGVIISIAMFLEDLGLTVEFAPVSARSTLPGIAIVANGIRVDRETLLYPGDLLHEAGHLAVMTPEERSDPDSNPTDPASEMGAIAWSAAAALHLGIPLEVVLHDQGYKGMAPQLRADVATGRIAGVPYLGWLGLTTLTTPTTKTIYPQMLGWLRTSEAMA